MATMAETVEGRPATFTQRARSRMNPTLAVGLGLLVLVMVFTLVVPLLSPYQSDEIQASDALSGKRASARKISRSPLRNSPGSVRRST